MSSYTMQDGVLGDPADLSAEYNWSLIEERAVREFVAGLICGQLLGCELKDLDRIYADEYIALAEEILNSLELEDNDPRPIADKISRMHFRRPLDELEADPRDAVNQLQSGPLAVAELILKFYREGTTHA